MGGVDVTEVLEAPCDAETLYDWVDDLARYPGWLDIVPRAAPVEPREGDPGPAWSVDLRGRLGPFARSKRLRMVRTVHDRPHHVRFERLEHDGRQHSSWTLDAAVAPSPGDGAEEAEGAEGAEGGSVLTMRLHYGGSLVGPVVERLLAEEIRRSRPRLLTLVAGSPNSPT
jgi:Polyketide cyclase / dehydrase and lipid transport